MSRCRLFLILLLGSLAGLLLTLNACSGGRGTTFVDQPPPPSSSQYIQHVVVIFQENRTPDNLFQDPVLIKAGADIAQSGKNVKSPTGTTTLTPTSLVTNYDLSHAHAAFIKMYNNGNMDGADNITVDCPSPCTPAAPPNPEYQYVQASDVQPY